MHNRNLQSLKHKWKRTVAFALTLATTVTLVQNTFSLQADASAVSTPEIAVTYGTYMEPVTVDADRDGDLETLFSTFTYGSYPQSQVTDSATLEQLEQLSEEAWTPMENPYISYWEENPSDYDSASKFAYTTIGSDRYLRMNVYDTSYGVTDEVNGLYQWEDNTVCHYYKFEPITWRILSLSEDGQDALVLADKVLDSQPFNYTSHTKENRKSSDWKYSTLRSFLNGYGSSENAYHADYSKGFSFIDLAFSAEEQNAILSTSLNNSEGSFSKTYGKNSTDQIFCLSVKEINHTAYGLYADRNRIGEKTDYTKQNGAYGVNENVFWWTRCGGDDYCRASNVDYQGDIHAGGNDTDSAFMGVRPAMHINLSALDKSAFSGYVDEQYNRYANQVIFNLDGRKTYTYTSADNHYIFKPYDYETDGYDYTYKVISSKGETVLTSFPKKVTKNCTITVSRQVQANTMIVYYKAPSSWSKAYIHYKTDGGTWTTAPGVAMKANKELSPYTYSFTIKDIGTAGITACFNNGKGTWDNNGEKNYTLSKLGVYGINGTKITFLSSSEPTQTPTATGTPTVQPVSNPITIYYANTKYKTTYLHYKLDNGTWTTLPGVKMTAVSGQSDYQFKLTLDVGSADSITMCFNNGSGDWDSANGANYTTKLTTNGIYGVKNLKVTALTAATPFATVSPSNTPVATATPVITAKPTATVGATTEPTQTPASTPTQTPVTQTITVYYSTGWSNPYIHFKTSGSDWTSVPGVKMEATTEKDGYNFKYVIPVNTESTSATVCFNNGSGNWDSKNGANYTFPGSGVYGVKNGIISKLP